MKKASKLIAILGIIFLILVINMITIKASEVKSSGLSYSNDNYKTLLDKVQESDNEDIVKDINKNESLRQLKTQLKYKESTKVALVMENERLKKDIEDKKEQERLKKIEEQRRLEEAKKQKEKAKKEQENKSKSSNKLNVSKKGNMRLLGVFNGSAYDDSPQSQGKWVGKTATGVKPQRGVVAVDPKVIPLGSRLYIESMDDYPDYGYAYAGDTGGAIKGRKIDLFMDTRSECRTFGRRNVRVYILD